MIEILFRSNKVVTTFVATSKGAWKNLMVLSNSCLKNSYQSYYGTPIVPQIEGIKVNSKLIQQPFHMH